MNRTEALRILGLDEEASADDIKAAYKEMAQILHPDRFASSKKLQDRATEQFKNLQEAYEYLTSKAGSKKAARGSSREAHTSRPHSAAEEYEARLAGIAAARTQLIAQRDTMLDERRNSAILMVMGAIVAILLRRFIPVAAIAGSAAIYSLVRVLSVQSTLGNLDEHIKRLNDEKKKIAQELEDLE